MKLTLIDNHLSAFFPFSCISFLISFLICCVSGGWKAPFLHAISLHWHAIWNSPYFAVCFCSLRKKSFCERFSCSAEINIFPLSRREYCFPIFHSLRRLLLQFILIFSHLVLSNVNSTRLFEINICLRLSFFAFFNTFFRDGNNL